MSISGSASTEINAPLEQVYRVLADKPGSADWQPELESVEVLEFGPNGEHLLVRTTIDLKVRKVELVMHNSYDPPTSMGWTMRNGPMKSLVGHWELEPLATDRTRVTVQVTVDLGRTLGLILRGPVQDALRARLVDSLPGRLKAHVEPGAGTA